MGPSEAEGAGTMVGGIEAVAGDIGATEAVARDVLAGADEVQALLGAGSPVTLLDVRWALGDSNGYQHYVDGHLPGAVFVDLDRELAAPASAAAGRHPLPTPADLQAAARRWGCSRTPR